ncbi:uncharacterized protein METZ01_LOCUS420836 [marine metagenome]|uniref:Uncharacterized protein n=1 Tax=marine metagenome TaxID=408172 RepID=A0A382XA94_9ZZZZ
MSDGLDINRSLKPAQKITHIRDYQAGISTCLITQFGLVSTHLILRIGRTIQWELSLTPRVTRTPRGSPPCGGILQLLPDMEIHPTIQKGVA